METYKYMRLSIYVISQEIINQYNLRTLVHNRLMYLEMRKGVYGLPQSGKLAKDYRDKHLAEYGYKPTSLNEGLWRHISRPITFSLVFDDCGFNYTKKCTAQNLTDSLKYLYRVSTYWERHLYCSITL